MQASSRDTLPCKDRHQPTGYRGPRLRASEAKCENVTWGTNFPQMYELPRSERLMGQASRPCDLKRVIVTPAKSIDWNFWARNSCKRFYIFALFILSSFVSIPLISTAYCRKFIFVVIAMLRTFHKLISHIFRYSIVIPRFNPRANTAQSL